MSAAGRASRRAVGRWILWCAALLPAVALGANRIGVVYNGGDADLGFNRLILEGVQRFQQERGRSVQLLLHANAAALAGSELERALAREQFDALLFATSTLGPVVAEIGERYPRLRLEVDDAFADGSGNLRSVRFRFEEGGYLAGIVAAQASRSGRLGFVAVDFSGLRRFGCAFAQAARATRADIQVDARLIAPSATAFTDAEHGRSLALQLIDGGADVVLHAAGGSGLGVLAAAAERKVYGIGVDANQNGLYPGHVLTSVLKRMDVAVYASLVALDGAVWHPGPHSVGLAEGAVDLAFDGHNAGLIDDATRQALGAARFALVAGDIFPAELDAADGCPYLDYPPASGS